MKTVRFYNFANDPDSDRIKFILKEEGIDYKEIQYPSSAKDKRPKIEWKGRLPYIGCDEINLFIETYTKLFPKKAIA